jgi:hypothetical protein
MGLEKCGNSLILGRHGAMCDSLNADFNLEYDRLAAEYAPQPNGLKIYPLFWQVPLGPYDPNEIGTRLARLIGQARFEPEHVIPLLHWIRSVANDVTVFTRNSWADIVFANLERYGLNEILGPDGASQIRTQVTGSNSRFSESFRTWAKTQTHCLRNNRPLSKYDHYRQIAAERGDMRWRVELINGECGFSEASRELTQRFFACDWQNANQSPNYQGTRFDEVVGQCTSNQDEVERLAHLRGWFVRSAVFLAETFHAIGREGRNPPDNIDEFLGWGDAPPEWAQAIPNFRSMVRSLAPFRRYLTHFGPPRISISFLFAGLFPGNNGGPPIPYISRPSINGVTRNRVNLPATLTFLERFDGGVREITSLRISDWGNSYWNALYWHEGFITLQSWKSRLEARMISDNGQAIQASRAWAPGLFVLEENHGNLHWDRINREGERQLLTGARLCFFPPIDAEGEPQEVTFSSNSQGAPDFDVQAIDGFRELVVRSDGFVPGSIRSGDHSWSLKLGRPAYRLIQASFVAQNGHGPNSECIILGGNGVRALYWANGLPDICLTCEFNPDSDPGTTGVLARLALDNAGIALQIGADEPAHYINFPLDDINAKVQGAGRPSTYDVFTSLGELQPDRFDNQMISTRLRVCPLGRDGTPMEELEQSCKLSRWDLVETLPLNPEDDGRVRLLLRDRREIEDTILSDPIQLAPIMFNGSSHDLLLIAQIPGDGRIQIRANCTLEGVWALHGNGTTGRSWDSRDLIGFVRFLDGQNSPSPAARLFAFRPSEGSITVCLDEIEVGKVEPHHPFPQTLWNLFHQSTGLGELVNRADRIIHFKHRPSGRNLGRLALCHFPVVEDFTARELPNGLVRIRFHVYQGWKGTQLTARFIGAGDPHPLNLNRNLMQTITEDVPSPPAGNYLLELVGTLAGQDRVLANQIIQIRRFPALAELPEGFNLIGLDQDWLWNSLEGLEGVMDPLQGWQGAEIPMVNLIKIDESNCYPPNTPSWHALKWIKWANQGTFHPATPFDQLKISRLGQVQDLERYYASHPNLMAHLACAIFRIIQNNRHNGKGDRVPLALKNDWLGVVNNLLVVGGPNLRTNLREALGRIQGI